MYVTVTPQKNIEGGVKALVEYLEKENKYSNGREMFFSSDSDSVKPREVVESLDENVKKLRLKSREAQFYNVLVAPSDKELKHIESDPKKLKEYVRGVMQEYAKGFNRLNSDGTPVTDKDLVWYAKLEKERTWGGKDTEVRHNEKYKSLQKSYKTSLELESRFFKHMPIEKRMSTEFKEAMDELGGVYVKTPLGNITLKSELGKGDKILKRGMIKSSENQSHIHIIVSRAHKTERMSLSPMANNRGGKNILNDKEVKIGFNRSQFAKNCEALFDLKFNYKRQFEHSTTFRLSKTKVIDKYNQKIVDHALKGMCKGVFDGVKINGFNQSNKAIYDLFVKDQGSGKFSIEDREVSHNDRYIKLQNWLSTARENENKYSSHVALKDRKSYKLKESLDALGGMYVKDSRGNITLKKELGKGDELVIEGMTKPSIIDKMLNQTYPDNVLKSLEHKALSLGGMDVYGMFNSLNLTLKVATEVSKTVLNAVGKSWYIGM